jgi:hypothetical protein
MWQWPKIKYLVITDILRDLLVWLNLKYADKITKNYITFEVLLLTVPGLPFQALRNYQR